MKLTVEIVKRARARHRTLIRKGIPNTGQHDVYEGTRGLMLGDTGWDKRGHLL